ncbi:MAG: 6-phosphogluconolactonase [Patulibacter minatonensis]
MAAAPTSPLAGGTTPGLLYDELTKQRFDWTGVHLWIGDERCVPHEHPDSNVRLVHERLPAPGAVLHAPPPVGTPEIRAAAYAAQLKDYVLDLVLLGLGEDAHTASLFPGNAAIDDPATVVAVHDAPKPPPERISLGLGVLRRGQGPDLPRDRRRQARGARQGARRPDTRSALVAAPGRRHHRAGGSRRARLAAPACGPTRWPGRVGARVEARLGSRFRRC